LIAASDSGSFGSSTHFYGDAAFSAGAQLSGGVQPAGVLTPSGDLWFAATDGALRIRPALSFPANPFPLVIEQVRKDGESVPLQSPVRIPATVQQSEIDYAAVRLDSPDQTRFRYRLEGLESRWTDAGVRRAAFYTHIPPGTYRFHVQAFDQGSPDRVINAEIPLTFEPHVYQTIWFYTVCGLLLICVIASSFLLHRRRLHERFEVVLAERNRVAREMHDTVIQGCIGVSTLLEAAHSTEQSFPEKSRLLIERATMQNKHTIDEARHAVWNLRHETGSAQQLPFGYILASLVADLREETQIPISLQITETLPVFSVDAGESLLNVVREAMLNATRHACATQIQLLSHVGRRALTLNITDNGHGFSPQSNNPLHYGITGMRERVSDLNGQISIISRPGAGTTVRITLPLKSLVSKLPEVIL
jgi:signal transduction histidine kinase